MDDAASTAGTHLLTIDAVKWAIGTLSGRRIHPHFLAYLQLHRRATLNPSEYVDEPRWAELKPLLEVPGGPPKKPNYRPLWTNVDNDGSAYWLNGNLAGSFAKSSIRTTAGFLIDGGRFALAQGHVEKVLEALLYERPAPAVAMGAYFLRNFGFFTVEAPLTAADIVLGFREWFGFEDDDEFNQLFDSRHPAVEFPWFEPVSDEEHS
jgi:hypothetical protein